MVAVADVRLSNKFYDAILYFGILSVAFGVTVYLITNNSSTLIGPLLGGSGLILLSIAQKVHRNRPE